MLKVVLINVYRLSSHKLIGHHSNVPWAI